MKVIVPAADASFEEVELPSLIGDLVQTRTFRRLQGITQLSFAWLILPRATHTRYQHSLLTWHLGTRVLKALDLSSTVSEEGINRLLAALLFHDVGHYPFSHVLEAVEGLIPHEENSIRTIMGDSEIEAILHMHGLTPEGVAHLIEPPAGGYQSQEDVLLHSLLSADALGVDVDRMAHILLDSWLCGIPYDEWVNMDQLIHALRVHPNVYGAQRGLVITPDGIEPLQTLLTLRTKIRKMINSEVPCAARAMTVKATEEALNGRVLRQRQLVDFTDHELLVALCDPAMPSVSRTLARRLLSGKIEQLYHTALTIGRHDPLFALLEPLHQNSIRCRSVEQALSASLGLPVLLSIPGPISKGRIDMLVLEEGKLLTPWRTQVSGRKDEIETRRIRVFVPPENVNSLSYAHVREKLEDALCNSTDGGAA